MSTEKARMISLRLAEMLRARIGTLALVEGVGASGDPLITIGAGSNGGVNAVIRVVPFSAPIAKDVLGLASTVFTPHVVQLATEANNAAGSGADILTRQQLMNFLAPVLGIGAQVEWYEEANGTAPVEATITSSKLKATVPANPYWTLMGQ